MKNTYQLADINHVFFIGIAGVGMSAIAQYLCGIGKQVSGSDRYFVPTNDNDIKQKLTQEGITCYSQNGEGITKDIDVIVISTAIESTVPDMQIATQLNIPIIMRSDMLAIIAESKRTVAIGGTSGKSTTGGMLYQILFAAGLSPSIISGAGLVSIIKQGKIGNAIVGNGDWLIIEADESDGSITKYHADIGLLLNVDKDHQEITELLQLFLQFKNNTTRTFIVNQSNPLSATLSTNIAHDFAVGDKPAGYIASQYNQTDMSSTFCINDVPFYLNSIGKHNMENALAAVAVASQIGVSLQQAAIGIAQYEGIYRRHQLIGQKKGIIVIDDYAHNPAKCAASILACQPLAPKVIAWFQPHGYAPTRFLKNDFIKEIAATLREADEIWMSEIFYAGGSAQKDISANDLIEGIKALGKNAYFVPDRNSLLATISSHFTPDCVFLLMGARDPSLETFGKQIFEQL